MCCRRLGLLLAVLLLLPLACAGGESAYASYVEIPGVTEAEIAGIEALKALYPQGLVYGMVYSDEAFPMEDGTVGGFASLLCGWLEGLLDIPIMPRVLAWDDLVAGLEDHSIALSGDFTPTPQRLVDYHMTSPITERSYAVFHCADQEDLDLLGGEGTYRYGFLVGSTTYDGVLHSSEVAFTATYLQNFQEAAKALREGRIDAFICEAMEGAAFEDDPDIVYQDYYPVVATSVALTTANPAVYPVIDVLQHYIDQVGMGHLETLYAQGKRAYLGHVLRARLTEAERAYLDAQAGTSIPIAAEVDNYPNSFYNVQEAAWQGIAHDILREIETLTGLSFQPATRADALWSEMLVALEAGEVDMVTDLMPSKGRAGRFLWAEAPYVQDYFALLSLTDTEDMTVSQVLHARVGVVRASVYEEMFQRLFPEHASMRVYADTVACFNALEAGEIDLAMMSGNLLYSAVNYMERPGFKVNLALDIACESSFGFHLDQALLRGVVSKAQAMVDTGAIVDRWTHKAFDYNKKLAQERIPYLLGMSVLLGVVLLLVVILFRKRERVTRLLGMTDHLTQLPNRRYYDERLRHEWEEAIKRRLHISLLTIDVDLFKVYNDTYGHPQGDVLLQRLAAIFAKALKRQTDVVARIGGEEFAVILPNTDAEGARVVAEKIRAAVASAVVANQADGAPTRATVSIGVATAKPRPDDSLKAVITHSDQALYQAKAAGRDCVSVAAVS